MRLSELCPFPVFVNWEGQPVEIKPFSLRAKTWAERFFFDGKIDGFERMNRILRNEEGQEVFFNSVIDIVYYLGIVDFEKIGVESSEILKNKIAESDDKLKIIENFKAGLEEILIESFPDPETKRPDFKGGKRFDEGRKQIEQKDPENWEQVYIEFYRAGGMSINSFMNLTARQINPLLKEIHHKKNEELNILSDLIHKKITVNKPQRQLATMDFTEKDVKTFEQMHQQLVEQSRIN